METTVPRLAELDEMIEGLTAARQFLDEHPDLPDVTSVYGQVIHLWLHRYDMPGASMTERDEECRRRFARAARILMAGAPIGSIKKDSSDVAQSISRSFGKVRLSLHASREAVCERRVIGTETVQVPDPAAPTVEVEREIIEWVCAPILPEDRTKTGAHYAAVNAALEDEQAVSA